MKFEFGLGTTPFCNFGFFWGCSGNEKVNGNANLLNETESLIKTKERKNELNSVFNFSYLVKINKLFFLFRADVAFFNVKKYFLLLI